MKHPGNAGMQVAAASGCPARIHASPECLPIPRLKKRHDGSARLRSLIPGNPTPPPKTDGARPQDRQNKAMKGDGPTRYPTAYPCCSTPLARPHRPTGRFSSAVEAARPHTAHADAWRDEGLAFAKYNENKTRKESEESHRAAGRTSEIVLAPQPLDRVHDAWPLPSALGGASSKHDNMQYRSNALHLVCQPSRSTTAIERLLG
jgi:hypothetical protein